MPYLDVCGEIPSGLDAFSNYQAYNILDSAITAQLLPVMKSKLNENHLRTYKREIRVLALCLEMSTKGLPIDQLPLAELLYQLEKDAAKALQRLHLFCDAVDARRINPRSTIDVPWLFYTHLRLPAIYNYDRKTKQRKLTSDDKALEKLRENYPIAMPFVNAILAYREAAKMGSVFKRGLEPSRSVLRCNFSPSGTETGRLSSQQNPYGRGTNAQNLTDRVRQGIGAPEGYAILNLDLKSAESIAVGFIADSPAYREACFSSDIHTEVAKQNWQEVTDRESADKPYYRHFSFRDMAKRGGHLSNYCGKPPMMAKSLKLPISKCQEFQDGYFKAFPELVDWHFEVIARIQRDGIIVTQLGRERRFWGRPDDNATHREAVAFHPQSLVGDVMNEGLVQVLLWLKQECRDAQTFIGRNGRLIPFTGSLDLRAQVHDSGVFLIPIEALDTLVPMVQDKLQFPVDFGPLGHMLIPSDASVGKRWCKAPKEGATMYTREGLRDWKPGQPLHWL